MSQATVTTSSMELTPMRVTFGGVDLGGTMGNVTVTAKYSKADIKADQSGTTVRDSRTSGLDITLSMELNEIQNKNIWKTVFPFATKIGSGNFNSAAIEFQQSVGQSYVSLAQVLVLHPLSKQDSDTTTDYSFNKAIGSAESAIVYGPTEQSKLKVTFMVYPDEASVPNNFFRFGDSTIVQTPASFVAAVPAGGNVGNGTISGTAVNNQNTKTETITLMCVTAGATGKFYISGSVSGPLGLATVGSSFTSSPIAFLINDGSTHFAVGDSFTIATVAAL